MKQDRNESSRLESLNMECLPAPGSKAAVNASQSKRFARFDTVRQTRSVWSATASASLSLRGSRAGEKSNHPSRLV